MATAWDKTSEETKAGATFNQVLLEKGVVIAAESRDPLGTSPTEVLRAGTPMAPESGGSGEYKPVRMTRADGGCTTSQTVVPVEETTMFAVGDVITTTDDDTPVAAASALGTIASISAGVSVTLGANATTAVASGDIIAVAETDIRDDTGILLSDVDLRDSDGDAVDSPGAIVTAGQIPYSNLAMNTAEDVTLTRVASVLPLIDFVAETAGTVDT